MTALHEAAVQPDALLEEPAASAAPEPAETRVLPLREQVRWIAAHWRIYRGDLAPLLALTLANAVARMLTPLIVMHIVDAILEQAGREAILRQVALLLGLGAATFAIYATLQSMRARLNVRFDYSVRMRAFEHILRMGPAFFHRFRTGDLVTRLTDDVSDKMAWYMCSGIFRFVEAAAIIAAGAVMMLRLDPELTLYAAGPLPVLIALFVVTAHRLERRYSAVQASISRLNEALESCFSGIRVVKAFAAEESNRAAIEAAIEKQRHEEMRAVRWQMVIESLYGHVWQLAIVGVLLAGGAMTIRGEITLGTLVAFDAYVLMLVWPMFDVGQFFVRGRLSAVTVSRVAELESMPPEAADPGEGPVPGRRPDGPRVADEERPERGARGSRPALRFEGVRYRYPGARQDALSGITFTAEPGGLTAVAGEIGSGKSTLLALVPRLMDPAEGRVAVGEEDVRLADPRALRAAIGYVPQEPLLFSTTLEENVRFGRSWISEEDLREAVELACLAPDLAAWPDGLRTAVGTRGLRLSGGQKQRVAIARALAGRPSVLLLDDCTASLDAETETALWAGLARRAGGFTALVVTHRPATLERAGRILVLEGGRAVEQGTFGELNREGSLFHRLYVEWQLRGRLES